MHGHFEPTHPDVEPRQHICPGAEIRHLAMVQMQNLSRQTHNTRSVDDHHDGRPFGFQPGQGVAQLPFAFGIQQCIGFIQKQILWIGIDGARQGNPPFSPLPRCVRHRG